MSDLEKTAKEETAKMLALYPDLDKSSPEAFFAAFRAKYGNKIEDTKKRMEEAGMPEEIREGAAYTAVLFEESVRRAAAEIEKTGKKCWIIEPPKACDYSPDYL